MRRRQVYTMLDRWAGWVLPPRCVLCRRPGQRPAFDLCTDCEVEIPLVPDPCPRCGLPCHEGEGATVDGCPRCRTVHLPYSRCLAPWRYEFPVTRLVQGLKYEGALANARVFGTRLARAAAEINNRWCSATLVVPMPLHPSRLVERGFNQSHEIARVVTRLLDLELAGHALRRNRATAPQVGLDRAARLGNLRGAFSADPGTVNGMHVILVDDVVTTGSTAVEAASTLRAAGAATVEVWAAARALASPQL
jgi:ComF family protein